MGAQAVRLSNVDIDKALENKEFEILFQPIFDLGNGALARVETFLRWRHPSLGVLPPGAFISFFESQGRMGELTRYVLQQALSEYTGWRGASAPGLSINLALSDLSDDAFASHFGVLMRELQFPADLVTLECPMPPVTMDVDTAANHFHRLEQTGARLAIEVRGRANDFLRTIDPFPFDEIKTGGAAILRFARTVRGPGLTAISELLEIASKANAAITAVGVEDQASLSALRGLGFSAAQGNHLGKVGRLAAFTPGRINEVRKLLSLEPLDNEALQELFRTEAPAPQRTENVTVPAGADDPTAAARPQLPDKDDLVERLAARLARQADADRATTAAADTGPDKDAPAETAVDDDAAKAAAIARAKRKAALRRARAEGDSSADKAEAGGDVTLAAARKLQERLSREFAAKDRQADPAADTPFDFKAQPEETGAAAPASEATAPNTNVAPAPQGDAVEWSEAPADPEETHMNAEKAKPAVDQQDAGAYAAGPTERAGPSSEAPQSSSPGAGDAARTVSDEGAPQRLSLAVGKTFAYFRPGFRVGVATPVSPLPATDAGAVTGDLAEPLPGQTPAAGEAMPQNTDVEETGDLDSETNEATATQRAQPRRRRRKNFLTRKYDIRLPSHFWPRSWKRAWRRRQADAAARRAERENERTAEEIAAE